MPDAAQQAAASAWKWLVKLSIDPRLRRFENRESGCLNPQRKSAIGTRASGQYGPGQRLSPARGRESPPPHVIAPPHSPRRSACRSCNTQQERRTSRRVMAGADVRAGIDCCNLSKGGGRPVRRASEQWTKHSAHVRRSRARISGGILSKFFRNVSPARSAPIYFSSAPNF